MFHKRYVLASLLVLALVSVASAEWNEQVLYSFQGGTDGSEPTGGMAFDTAGNLYGATTEGGAFTPSCGGTCGTVFELSPPRKKGDPWTETILYVFGGHDLGDGDEPTGGLIRDAAGNLYGVTGYGGSGDCTLLGIAVACGTAYELSPPSRPGGSWTETVLYSFQGGEDGYLPQGDLVFDESGNLYGATMFGGGEGKNCNLYYGGNCGTIFELSPPKVKDGAWTEKLLHSFASAGLWSALGDGAEPNGGLILDDAGNLYGTTYFGGYALAQCNGGVDGTGCGAVFELIKPANEHDDWTENIIHRFVSSDGAGPEAGLTWDASGNLYGTTLFGGGSRYPSGTIFRLQPQPDGAWTYQILYSFVDDNNGGYPVGPLAFGPDGHLFGTTTAGGIRTQGTLLQLDPLTTGTNTWGVAALYGFAGYGDVAYPDAKLILSRSGVIYSTSLEGGTGSIQNCQSAGCGTVYKVSP